MKLVAKIFLLLCVFFIALIPAVSMLILLFNENQRFDFAMSIPFGITLLGIGSVLFHVNTIQFYKNLMRGLLLPKPNNLLLGLNLGFATSLILVALLFVYIIFLQNQMRIYDSEMIYILLFVGTPSLLGTILFAEYFFMRKKLNENKEREVLSEIDNIQGNNKA